MAKATIISLVPRVIREIKPGLNPGVFMLAAAKTGPEVLVVDDGNYPIYVGDGKHLIQEVPAKKLADSVVSDYISGQFGIDEICRPAILAVEGEWVKDAAAVKFKKEISQALEYQRNWFVKLVRLADDDWAKFRQHRMISDLQRDACKALDMKREWLVIVPDMDLAACPACGINLPIATALVCSTCKTIIKPKEYKEQGFAQVG